MSDTPDPKAVQALVPAEVDEAKNARAVMMPSVNAATVMVAYPNGIVGADVDLAVLIEGLRGSCARVKEGDLSDLEAMLVGQAQALQAIFTSLAGRAQAQTHPRQFEALLALALKAQAQSRATIQALAELKYPRQVAFVKQANISHGPQQVNNGDAQTASRARGKKQCEQNKLLEDNSDGRTHLDGGATPKAGRGDPAVETMGKVDRAEKRGR